MFNLITKIKRGPRISKEKGGKRKKRGTDLFFQITIGAICSVAYPRRRKY